MQVLEISRPTLSLLELLQWPGVGVGSLRKVIPGGPMESAEAISSRLPKPSIPDAKTLERARATANSIIDSCWELGVSILSPWDAAYPVQLNEIEDAPPILYVRGNVEALKAPCGAVVGTRECSEHGRRAAGAVAEYLAARGIGVVSGLALGIDAAAHAGALQAGGRTVAVLAHGLDRISPTANKELGLKMLEQGGALVAEHAPGVPPRRAEFVRRNRIQSGLSFFSVIVESGEVGGAMHQARFTKEQRRKLLVVLPRSLERSEFRTEGGRLLVREMEAVAIGGTRDLELALRMEPMVEPEGQLDLPL